MIEDAKQTYEGLSSEKKKTSKQKKVEKLLSEQYIVDSLLNLRKGPSFNDEVIRVMGKGETVNVHSCEDGWAKLDDGYCCVAFLKKK